MLELEGDEPFTDLEARSRNILRREAIYRPNWVATMSDQALKELGGIGPKILMDIRRHIPYSGPLGAGTEGTSPAWERCPTCYGTGLKLSEAVLYSAIQQV